jgi:hypothetical protein
MNSCFIGLKNLVYCHILRYSLRTKSQVQERDISETFILSKNNCILKVCEHLHCVVDFTEVQLSL